MSGPINVTAALRDMREKQSLNERWNENLAKRGLVEFRTMYRHFLNLELIKVTSLK